MKVQGGHEDHQSTSNMVLEKFLVDTHDVDEDVMRVPHDAQHAVEVHG